MTIPRHYRRIIKITAEDSPNVKRARRQIAEGKQPDDAVVLEGVLTWGEYQKRRATWDAIEQCVGLDAEFYEGAEIKMFPPDWLQRAAGLSVAINAQRGRRLGKALGCDPGEGGDDTAWCVADEFGLQYLIAYKTPDTNEIPSRTLQIMREWGVPPENVVFDRGGGGKEHADRLRAQGFPVRTVAFGEPLTPDPERGMKQFPQRLDEREDRYAYANRRAQMYGDLRLRLDPNWNPQGFAVPDTDKHWKELHRQLSLIPLTHVEGRLTLLPKDRKGASTHTRDGQPTCLKDLMGCSPDEADAAVLALHGVLHKPARRTAGVGR